MSIFVKALKVTNSVNNVAKLLTKLSINNNVNLSQHFFTLQRMPTFHQCALLHTTSKHYGLMEFFDEEKNWSKNKIQVGRSWKTDELRIKSNEDLHKLWYVLLKERNMLLTMEKACFDAYELFPNPERLDKVNISMENIETVVRERNNAYYKLETGETAEQPAKYIHNILGMKQYYKLRQYMVPKFMNSTWKKKHLFGYNGYAVRKFLSLYREKLWNIKRKAKNRDANSAITLIKKFPNLNLECLQEKYPNVDIQRILKSNKLKSLRMASRQR